MILSLLLKRNLLFTVIYIMEKVLIISFLYDFYGQLLTEKQQEVIELYYSDDLSLGEISESMGISRQGVFDLLKRSEKLLYGYEEKLKLVEKFIAQKGKIREAYELLNSMGSSEKIDRIKSILEDIL